MANPLKYAYILETNTCIDFSFKCPYWCHTDGHQESSWVELFLFIEEWASGCHSSDHREPTTAGTSRFVDKWHDSIYFGKLVIPQLF